MKSLVVEGPGRMAVIERPIPVPAPGEVRVKIERAGICGSDVHIFHGTNPFVQYPRTIGHEFFGHIEALGAGATAKIGTRVVIDPVVACGHCYPCSIGRPNVCDHLQVIGVHRDGGFAEFACVPEGNAHAVPYAMPDERATLVEPFTIAANITDRTGASERDVALVYGAGPIGLTVIQVLKHVYGVRQLIVSDQIDARLDLALASGADQVINGGKVSLLETLKAAGIRPTLIIDAACHPSILAEAVEIASPAARIGIMGFSSEPSALVQQKVTAKELAIHSSRLNGGKFDKVIGWFARGLLAPEKLLTHRFALSDWQAAFDAFENDPVGCCKVQFDLTTAS